MPCLETDHLVYRYSTAETVLSDISLRVPTGSIYGFLGPNGAGKTTTLRLILGLLKHQQGEIRVFGRSLHRHRLDILRKVGSLIESPSVYGHLSARDNLRILQLVHRCPPQRIDAVLQLVDLQRAGLKRVSGFSLGMKQRLSIAMALLHEPSLLILDEPTNGLDPNGILEMRELLCRLNAQHGVSILISSHLLAEIEKLVSHIGILDKGRLLFQGSMDELQARQQQNLRIRICTDDDARAIELLRSRQLPAEMLAGGLHIPQQPEPQIAALNRLLVNEGLAVYEITPVQDDLESIFMKMIGN